MTGELEAAQRLLSKYRQQDALVRLKTALSRPDAAGKTQADHAAFVSAVTAFAELALLLGKELESAVAFLERGLELCRKRNELRNFILMQLTLGHALMLLFRNDGAYAALAEGTKKAMSLGDADILSQTARHISLFYFIQGRFQEALAHAEIALKSLYDPASPFFKAGPITVAGLSAIFLGRFHCAVGMLDFHCHFVRQHPHFIKTSADHIPRATLGMAMDLLDKPHEALFHLNAAARASQETKNAAGCIFAHKGLAFHFYKEGDLEKAAAHAGQIPALLGETTRISIICPWILEMYYQLEKQGWGHVIKWDFQTAFAAIMDSVNIHMQGAALRLRAMDALSEDAPPEKIFGYLSESEAYLQSAGDPIQLAKTRIETARLKLRAGRRKEAYALAMNARKGVAGYYEDIFPPALQELLGNHYPPKAYAESADAQLDRIFTLFEEMGAALTGDFADVMLAASSRFFRAEHSALFMFDEKKDAPELAAIRNMTADDVAAKEFQRSLALARKAFLDGRPVIARNGAVSEIGRRLSVICLPFDAGNGATGVIYHDNVYLKDGLTIDEEALRRLSRLISVYYGQNLKNMEKEAADRAVLKKSIRRQGRTEEFLFPTPALNHLTPAWRTVAASDASVLITGETGAGKEVLANWLHEQSPRRDNPLIVLEPSAIPETLIESDLFGHEKGAFTGADHRKMGKIELAHTGTLFIDEIGEIPESIQIKLLRVLEEKRIRRIGGWTNIDCDFRLLAATSRNLTEEVRGGRFREDLFYRLNVIEMTLPPLRDRRKDILPLARHFLTRYARRYNRARLRFSRRDEKRLTAFDWPGNVRELRNLVERAALLAVEGRMNLDLPSPPGASRKPRADDWPDMDELQRRYIRAVLKKTNGRISGPGGGADILGMKRATLYARMNKLGLR